jgi:hypothetical protein
MQMTTRNSLKIVGTATLAGALVAGVFAFRTQDRYVSTAVMRFTPVGPAGSDRQVALDRLAELQQKALSCRKARAVVYELQARFAEQNVATQVAHGPSARPVP